MFDTILRRVPWVIAAVMLLTVTGQAALAGTDDGISPASPGINAGTVDRLHAVKSTATKSKRAGKLMAFAASGYLPTNIVPGGVATVAALQSTTGAVNEADNLVHWNQLQGVPPTIADGVDAPGYISSVVAPTGGSTVPTGGVGIWVWIEYPVTVDVEATFIPTYIAGAPDEYVIVQEMAYTRVNDTTLKYWYHLFQESGVAVAFKVRVRVFDQGIAPAALKRIARSIDIGISKKGP